MDENSFTVIPYIVLAFCLWYYMCIFWWLLFSGALWLEISLDRGFLCLVLICYVKWRHILPGRYHQTQQFVWCNVLQGSRGFVRAVQQTLNFLFLSCLALQISQYTQAVQNLCQFPNQRLSNHHCFVLISFLLPHERQNRCRNSVYLLGHLSSS